MVNSEDLTNNSDERFTPRGDSVEHVLETDWLNCKSLSNKSHEELIPDIKIEYSITTVHARSQDAPEFGPKTEFKFGQDRKTYKHPDIRPCVVVLERLPAALIEKTNNEKHRNVDQLLSKIFLENRNEGERSKAIPYKCILHVQLSEEQKSALIQRALDCGSFLRPAREFSQKWGVLVSERNIKKAFDDYISRLQPLPPELLVSPEMLALKSMHFTRTIDLLTLAEKLEVIDKCKHMYTNANQVAQFVYDRFGKIISCPEAANIFKSKQCVSKKSM